ncbi:hypothetical protein ACLB2K_052802 [Fragaria x ananassa]
MFTKKRKVGRPRNMSEILSPSGSASGPSGSSSSQSSHTSLRVPFIPPTPPTPPPPPPPQPTQASILPLPGSDAEPHATANTVGRGHSKGIPEWNTGEKVHIMFDSKFQPIGERAAQLKSQLGKMVRDGRRIPLTILDWKAVDLKVKEEIWDEVKKNLVDVPEGYKPVCLKCCNTLWKDHKSKTKANHFEPNKNHPDLLSMVPPQIIADQWTVLVAYWNSEDAKAIATRNSINRETRGPSHNTGRKHFAHDGSFLSPGALATPLVATVEMPSPCRRQCPFATAERSFATASKQRDSRRDYSRNGEEVRVDRTGPVATDLVAG